MAKLFKQFILLKDDNNTIFEALEENQKALALGIHALPGTKIQINQSGVDDALIINSTGNFSIDCEDFPIFSIKVDKAQLSENYPTIIDIIYEEGINI